MPDSTQPERILLVDDEHAIVDAATTGLTRAGYSVRGTTSPHEAIDLAIREPFDLLLSDIMMPGLSGIELLRTMKHLYPDVAAVMITGFGTMESAIEALHAGANGFLLKPFTAGELRLAVEDALAKSRILKENVRLKALMPLYESSKAFYGEMSLERLAKTVTEQVAKSVDADQVSVFLTEGKPDDEPGFREEAAFPASSNGRPVSETVLDWVAKTSEPLALSEGASTNLPPELSGVPRAGPALYLPLKTNGQLVGILRVKKAGADQQFGDGELEILSVQASQAALAIHNALLIRDLEQGYLDALAALANALEARDIETRGHTERLSRNGVRIAEQMGLCSDDQDSVRIGGLLHDIGKIGVPDAILRKPAKLTTEEFAVIRQHPIIGDRILAPIPQFQKARAVVLGHHERWDGNGYPFGLKGEDIPIPARVIAVVDVFDALTESRVYHAGESVVTALEELRKASGTHFDPKVVEAFFDVLQVARHART